LTARDRATVIAAIGRQLRNQPLAETRNRKPLRRNPIAPLEAPRRPTSGFLKVGRAASRVVRILAVGRKQRNVLIVGRKELQL
jgi:hypothetical protein